MKKLISVEEAVAKVKDGMTVMIGGFLSNGTPNAIVNALAQSEVKNLILIVNDTAYPDKGCGQLIANKQVKKVIVSHIGTNPCTSEQMNSGELEIEFSPQGTLAERIRSGGAGLGGVLTPTGIGTLVAEGKQVLNIDGKDYLLEKPLRADVALIGASVEFQSTDGDGCRFGYCGSAGVGRNRRFVSRADKDSRNIRGFFSERVGG